MYLIQLLPSTHGHTRNSQAALNITQLPPFGDMIHSSLALYLPSGIDWRRKWLEILDVEILFCQIQGIGTLDKFVEFGGNVAISGAIPD